MYFNFELKLSDENQQLLRTINGMDQHVGFMIGYHPPDMYFELVRMGHPIAGVSAVWITALNDQVEELLRGYLREKGWEDAPAG